jgi:hypothetical protein
MRVLPCALLLVPAVLFAAQGEKQKWQRVHTGEDSIIEIDVSRVTFVEYSSAGKVTFSYKTGRVGFRTILSKPELVKDNAAIKYKTQLETFEFNCAGNTARYRLYESMLLDDRGKVVKNYGPNPSREWKEAKFGSMMNKLAGAACILIDEKRRNP